MLNNISYKHILQEIFFNKYINYFSNLLADILGVEASSPRRAEKVPQTLNKMPGALNHLGRAPNKRVAAPKKPPSAPNPVSLALDHSPKDFSNIALVQSV
ncbi:hypothetical protein HNR44_000478 [Geomicrobium halophilum]|uniref:Uncharacterized protein n=1 Tax=Geomicrobium halophilum TaxID=549000 RepID=A0A841PIF9_9BACL|nr:hypothetical protein [Geomicrobium halophilum]